ncbi:MAG: hypothetical protein ACOC2Y_06525 [Spirochaetota bacterium]
MRGLARVFAAVLLVAAVGTPGAYAEEGGGSTVIEDAEPYEPGEFPEWATAARRAEIVALGSFPITLFVSRSLYTLGRFAVASINRGELAPDYLPPAFAPPGAQPLTEEDEVWMLVGAVSLSAVVALIDYVLGLEEPPNG